jgi:hypothetical protein
MTEKKSSWVDRLMGCFGLEAAHHRTCRLCHQRILRAHKYRHAAGLLGADRVEHKDCANPMLESPELRARRMIPELPFDAPRLSLEVVRRGEGDPSFVDGAIYPSYGDAHQEKSQ